MFSRTRDIINFLAQGLADSAFYTIFWDRIVLTLGYQNFQQIVFVNHTLLGLKEIDILIPAKGCSYQWFTNESASQYGSQRHGESGSEWVWSGKGNSDQSEGFSKNGDAPVQFWYSVHVEKQVGRKYQTGLY